MSVIQSTELRGSNLSTELWESATESGLEWQDDALCAEIGTEMFFPEKGGSTKDAKKVCADCPVAQQCLNYALQNDERFGIWGGLSERERRKLHAVSTRSRANDRREAVKRLHANGQSDTQIGAILGVSSDYVWQCRKRLGLPSNLERRKSA